MKRKVHQAFIEELPQGHRLNPESGPCFVAGCHATGEDGGSARSDLEVLEGAAHLGGPIQRALAYLDSCCQDAEHVL